MPTDFAFTGQRHDTSTGLYFFHARYYHSGVGRFVSADTIVPEPGNPQDLNRYSYVRNSPLAYVDPSGHTPGRPPNSPIVDPLVGLLQAFSAAPPEWFLHYMPLYVQDNFPHLLEHPIEDWGLWNTGMVVKGTADLAYDAGAIEYDTFMEWYVGGISIASSDPVHQQIVGMQTSYGVELGMIGSALLPSFDQVWEYSDYWKYPGETYKFNLGSVEYAAGVVEAIDDGLDVSYDEWFQGPIWNPDELKAEVGTPWEPPDGWESWGGWAPGGWGLDQAPRPTSWNDWKGWLAWIMHGAGQLLE